MVHTMVNYNVLLEIDTMNFCFVSQFTSAFNIRSSEKGRVVLSSILL